MPIDYFWVLLVIASIAGAIDNHIMLGKIRTNVEKIRQDQIRIMEKLDIKQE